MSPPDVWERVAILRLCKLCQQWRNISKFERLEHVCNDCLKWRATIRRKAG